MRISRHQLFIAGLMIIALFYGLNKFSFLSGASYTLGKFTGYSIVYSTKNHEQVQNFWPLIEYQVAEKKYELHGVEYVKYDKGSNVKLVYQSSDPSLAYEFSFFGFWYYGILYSVIAVILLTIACYGLLHERHLILLRPPFTNKGVTGISLIKLPPDNNPSDNTTHSPRKQ